MQAARSGNADIDMERARVSLMKAMTASRWRRRRKSQRTTQQSQGQNDGTDVLLFCFCRTVTAPRT